MELIRGMHNLRPQHRGCVATIGNFDGVHRGHQEILQNLRLRAAELAVPAMVIIFEPQPQEFFAGTQAPPRLTPFALKMKLLQEQGIDQVLCLRFGSHLSSMAVDEFINRLLVDGIAVRHLIVGDDFRFGHQRKGDYHALCAAGERFGFSVANTNTVVAMQQRISSSRIRELLAEADLDAAEQLLGRPYRFCGRVIEGQKLGRQLGFPTANISLHGRRPALSGVFAVEVLLDGSVHQGVANVGMRPTVGGLQPLLEVHLLDYNGQLYGHKLMVIFRKRLRTERKFPDLAALNEAIAADVAAARNHFSATASHP